MHKHNDFLCFIFSNRSEALFFVFLPVFLQHNPLAFLSSGALHTIGTGSHTPSECFYRESRTQHL